MNRLFSVEVVTSANDHQTVRIFATSAAEAHVQASRMVGVCSVLQCMEQKQLAVDELVRLAAKNICDAFAREGYTGVRYAVERGVALLDLHKPETEGRVVLQALCKAFETNGFKGFRSVARAANAAFAPAAYGV